MRFLALCVMSCLFLAYENENMEYVLKGTFCENVQRMMMMVVGEGQTPLLLNSIIRNFQASKFD